MRAPTSSSASRRLAAGPLLLLALAVVAAVHALGLAFAVFERADSAFTDRLMRWRNRNAVADTSPVVHLDIDDRTVAGLGGQTAGRGQLAAIAVALSKAGAAAQVYDFVFASPGAEDLALASAFHEARTAFIGAAVTDHPLDRSGRNMAGPVAWHIQVEGEPPALPETGGVIWPAAGLDTAAAGVGVLNVPTDPDGVTRRLPLLFKNRSGGYFPSLALAVAAARLGVAPQAVVLRPHSVLLRGKSGDVDLPVDRTGAMLLDFHGDWEWGAHYSLGDAWRDSLDPTAAGIWRKAVTDRIVVIGDVSTGQADVGAAPVDRAYPLVGLHATAIRNILDGTPLHLVSPAVTSAVEAAVLLMVLAAAIMAPGWLMPAAGAGLAILLAGAGRAFVSSHAVMGVAGPFVEVVGFVGLASSWRYVDESRQRRRMRRAFEAYFPPAVVARLVESGQSFDESRRRELTIMFTDIAGFTARSSTMPPDEVQGFLNSYFSRMVEVAFRHGGTVDKFIGDGLMVFFNDPDDQPDHAERAVRCAIDMQAAVRAFSAEREADGEPPVRLRIGVHTGWAIVGALGSVERLSYTAVGAAVNMAQRLESNAPAGRVLVSAETASRLPPGIAVSRAPAIDAKGFDRPVDVYLIEPGLETGVS